MIKQSTNPVDISKQLLTEHPVPYSIDLSFEGCRLRVESNSQRLSARLMEYYAPYVVERHPVTEGHPEIEHQEPHIRVVAIQAAPPEVAASFSPRMRENPTKAIKEEFADLSDGRIVRKVRTGMVFFFNDRLQLTVGDCENNDHQVINFINSRYIEWLFARGGPGEQDRRGFLLHAAGVVQNGCAIVIAGTSGAGKSTLALHFLDHEFSLLSNDRIVLDRNGPSTQVFGVPKLPRVNPGTLLNHSSLYNMLSEQRQAELRNMPNDDLWALEEKYDVDVIRVFGPNKRCLLAHPAVLAILNWRRNNEATKIIPVRLEQRADLLACVMKERGAFAYDRGSNAPVDPTPEAYLKAMEDLPVYEVTGGVDFATAVVFFSKFLTQPACNQTGFCG